MDLSILTPSLSPAYVDRLSVALDSQRGGPARVERIVVNQFLRGSAPQRALTQLAHARRWSALEPGRNLSYSAANNQAAEYAAGEWLLLLNDDAIPWSNFLAELWAARERADIHGALHVHLDRTVNHAGCVLAPWPAHAHRGEPEEKFVGRGLIHSPTVTFAAALMRREFFERLGGLSEAYWYGFEDTDFCCRAIEAGARIGVNLSAVTIHGELGTRTGAENQENGQRFADAWLAKLPALAAKARANWKRGA